MNETILGVVIGGLIAGLPTVIITWLNHREERKRQAMEVAMKCATTEWKGIADACIDISSRGLNADIPPLRDYILNAYLTIRAASETNDPEKIKEAFRNADKLTKEIHLEANPKKRNQSSETTD